MRQRNVCLRAAALVGAVALASIVLLAGCSEEAQQSEPAIETIAMFGIDGSETIVDTTGIVVFDAESSSDGDGSLKVVAEEPATVALFELGDVDVENRTLRYQAVIRSEDVEGQVYLEMLCAFGEEGEYFSRSLDSEVSGSVDWTAQQTPFFLKAGENPTDVKLNFVIQGAGTAWIDDITVTTEPLPAEQ